MGFDPLVCYPDKRFCNEKAEVQLKIRAVKPEIVRQRKYKSKKKIQDMKKTQILDSSTNLSLLSRFIVFS